MGSRSEGLSGNAAQSVQAAAQALDAGRPQQAAQHLAALPAAAGGHPEVLRMHAGVLGMQGRHPEAIAAMRDALTGRPNDPVYLNTLGTLLGQAGDYDGAIEALRRCGELQPEMALAWYNLGVMLTRAVCNDEAIDALGKAVRLEPQNMLARSLLADLLRMRGDAEPATAEYRRILAAQPWAGMAWWGLADLRTGRFDETDIAQIQAAMRGPRASDDDRIAMGFALAKALDQVGQLKESLDALAEANALARRRRQWDRAGFSRGINAMTAVFGSSSVCASGALGGEVIFIVGLPRSGSTLVEQILASHSQVEGAGELPDLPQVLAEESRRRKQPFPQWVSAMQPTDWARLGQLYLQRTAHWRRERRVFTDKLPSNWIYAGAIAAMLPGARIVGCRRDALETCFSCYRQRLENNEYTRDFDDLASFWYDCNRSLTHWQRLHPQQVMLHDYEALLDDPEQQTRALLSFCGLSFEEACLRSHENRREVRSPSATQVRQPLRRDTGRAAAYGALLDPLRRALGLPPWP